MEENKDVEELFIIKLKKALNYYRITQYKFAKEIGINDQTLSDYFHKKRKPKWFSVIFNIFRYFDKISEGNFNPLFFFDEDLQYIQKVKSTKTQDKLVYNIQAYENICKFIEKRSEDEDCMNILYYLLGNDSFYFLLMRMYDSKHFFDNYYNNSTILNNKTSETEKVKIMFAHYKEITINIFTKLLDNFFKDYSL